MLQSSVDRMCQKIYPDIKLKRGNVILAEENAKVSGLNCCSCLEIGLCLKEG